MPRLSPYELGAGKRLEGGRNVYLRGAGTTARETDIEGWHRDYADYEPRDAGRWAGRQAPRDWPRPQRRSLRASSARTR